MSVWDDPGSSPALWCNHPWFVVRRKTLERFATPCLRSTNPICRHLLLREAVNSICWDRTKLPAVLVLLMLLGL